MRALENAGVLWGEGGIGKAIERAPDNRQLWLVGARIDAKRRRVSQKHCDGREDRIPDCPVRVHHVSANLADCDRALASLPQTMTDWSLQPLIEDGEST